MKRKVISLLLALCMILSLVPTTAFAEGPAYTYNLINSGGYKPGETTVKGADGGIWTYVGSYGSATNYPVYNAQNMFWNTGKADGTAWLAIKFQVPAAGTYDITMAHNNNTTFSPENMDVYVITDNANIPTHGSAHTFNSDDLLTTLSLDQQKSATMSLGAVTVAAGGEFTLVFVPRGFNGTAKKVYFRPKTLVLTKIADAASATITEIFSSVPELKMAVGKTDSMPGVTVKLSDGRTASKGEYTLLYSDYNKDIINVDDNGKITAKSAGDTKVTITATKDELPKTCTLPVKVLPVSRVDVVAEKTSLEEGQSTALSTKLVFSDGEDSIVEVIKNSAVSYACEITDGDATATISGSGVITATAPCKVKVTAKVQYDGIDYSSGETTVIFTKDETVYSGYELRYDFKEQNIPGSATTKLREAEYAYTYGFWRFHSAISGFTKVCDIQSYGMRIRTTSGQWFAIGLNVPVAGWYKAQLEHYKVKGTAGDSKLYLLKQTKDVAAVLADIDAAITDGRAFDIGEPNYSGADVAHYTTTESKKVHITEPGEYILVFHAGKGTDQYPRQLVLDGGDKKALGGIVLSNYKTVIEMGKKDTVSVAQAYLSDYTKIDAEDYSVSYSSADTNIATVDPTSGVITGVDAGDVDITVTATYEDGSKATAIMNVTVLPRYSSGYKVVYKLNNDVGFENARYDNTNNFWTYKEQNGTKEIIEINVPVAGKYHITYDGASGTVSIGETVDAAIQIENDGDYFFPEAGKYVVVFDGMSAGHPDTLMLTGGEKVALMDVKLQSQDNVVFISEGVFSDGTSEAFSGASVRYTLDVKYFDIASIGSSSGVLFAKDDCQVTVFADVTLDGITARGKIKASVKGANTRITGLTKTYNFNEVKNWPADTDHYIWDDSDQRYEGAYVNKTDGKGTENVTFYNTDGWQWYQANPASRLMIAFTGTLATSRLRMRLNEGNWGAIEIKVPEEGLYWVSTAGSKAPEPALGTGEVFLIPMPDEDKAEGTARINYINSRLNSIKPNASVNYNDQTLGDYKQVTDQIGAVYLTGETYLVVFRQASPSPAGYLTPRTLAIDSTNTIKALNFALEKNELKVGETSEVYRSVLSLDGDVRTEEDGVKYAYVSFDEDVVRFIDGKLRAVGIGTTEVQVTAICGGASVTETIKVNVTHSKEVTGVNIYAVDESYSGKAVALSASLVYEDGIEELIENEYVEYEIVSSSDEEGFIDGVIEDGKLLVSTEDVGKVTVIAKADADGETFKSEPLAINFKAGTWKTEPTLYTYERRELAKKNISEYSWANKTAKSEIQRADTILNNFENLYNSMSPEGLPRTAFVGLTADPNNKYCRYCGEDITAKYGKNGANAYDVDPYRNPWKIECPDCKTNFPTNDFEPFYYLGLVRDDNGDVILFDRIKALEAHREMLINKGKLDKDNPAAPGEEYSDSWYAYYGYGVEGGYLHNDFNTDLANVESLNCYEGLGDENPKIWGVDDGWGYVRINKVGQKERHLYMGSYFYLAWSEVNAAVRYLRNAYMYTDNVKYGNAGALIIDRLASMFPYFDMRNWWHDMGIGYSSGGNGYGKIVGRIADSQQTNFYIECADSFYTLFYDEDGNPRMNETLGEMLYQRTGNISKKNPDIVWKNWEDNLLWETFDACKNCEIHGNFGMHQGTLAAAALVLSSEPRSSEMMDWLFQDGGRVKWFDEEGNRREKVTGGAISTQFVNVIDRDGMGNESAANYNLNWLSRFFNCADYLLRYSDDAKYNVYKNPKYLKMFTAGMPISLVNTHTAQIADTGAVAGTSYIDQLAILVNGFKNFMQSDTLKDSGVIRELAKYIYVRNGYSVKGLNYGMFEDDPERVQQEILDLIEDLDDVDRGSEMMTGYGFSILRDGAIHGDKYTPSYSNTMRDFWIYSGINGGTSHAHYDALNLGLEAYGLNFAPDFGYPEVTGNDPKRITHISSTIMHNTVVVNEQNQQLQGPHGTPQHFDDSGDVKVMDIDSSNAYEITDIYRRTVVMINVGSDVSYGVDFFRVKGGNDHVYSFHGQSNDVYATDLNVEEKVGTYADFDESKQYAGYKDENGNELPGLKTGELNLAKQNKTMLADPWFYKVINGKLNWGNNADLTQLTYPLGYTWFNNIRNDDSPADSFFVDLKVTDYNRVLKDSNGLHLRLTMLTDGLSDVTLAKGYVPQKSDSIKIPKTFEFLLARKTGENLDTLYTTVYEPYKDNRYLSSMTNIEITPSAGETKLDAGRDTAKAVKVIRTDGRIDYIVYATNNEVTYTVTDGGFSFEFRGFVGVLSLDKEGGEVIYRYVNDGDILRKVGDTEPFAYKAYTGSVKDFTRSLVDEDGEPIVDNYVYMRVYESDAQPEHFVGRHMYITNHTEQNAVYKIVSAEKVEEGEYAGTYKLGTGLVSVILSYKDASNTEKGFNYNIGTGQEIVVPLSYVDDNGPVFGRVSDMTATVGNSVSINLAQYRTDENGESVIYSAVSGTDIPRGANLSSSTGKITWKPDDSQIGTHSFKIMVRDESGRDTAIYFVVTVYGSTTGAEEESSGGGGGGGGGGAPLPDEGDNEDGTGEDTTNPDGEDTGVGEGTTGGDADVRFIDLGSHAWAADAINALADAGIIKGTSENEYSPANNITRADYAILLVRAFEQTSENTENFDDVNASDYFAHELAIARNTGIVSGIGNNMFAPRKNIMRQDMMLMTYRALKALGTELEIGDVEAPDLDKVDEYALDAVRALMSNGLVNGKNGYIDGSAYTTRAEVAVLLKRILDFTAK